MEKRQEIMVRQTEFFSKALSMRLLEATEECIRKDGFVNESSMSMALSKLVSSHLAMVTENLSRKYEKEVLAMFFKTIENGVTECKKKVNNENIS